MPASLTDSDESSIAGYRQSFPYFVPARYIEALGKQKDAPFDPAKLTAAMPYIGDWVLFCDFINAAKGKISTDHSSSKADSPNKEVVKEVITEVVAEVITKKADATSSGTAAVEEAEPVVLIDVNTVAREISADELETIHKSFWIQEEEETAPADVAPETASVDNSAAGVADVIEVELAVAEEVPVANAREDKPLISPVYTEDYFLQQGEKVSVELPEEIDSLIPVEDEDEAAKSLMVMMSFSEWLLHFKNTAQKQKEETKDQRALKTMWQKEKLAAAMEEENEEIPENVFEMAVNSIAKEDGLASESLAEIYIKQGKYDRAVDMYRKLSLRNPQKNTYFALKIEEILKEKQS